MNKTSDKVIATLIVFSLGLMFFIMTPLWVGICFVIPGFSLFLRHTLNQKLELKKLDNETRMHKRGMYGFLGCRSLVERRNKYGF